MATQQDFLELRTPKNSYRELIVLWFSTPDIGTTKLEEYTKPLAKISINANDLKRYVNDKEDYTKIFLITSNDASPRATRYLNYLLRLQNRDIRLIIYVLGQNNNDNVNEGAQYFNNFNDLSEQLQETLLATNDRSCSPADLIRSSGNVSWSLCSLSNIKKENCVIYWKRLLVDILIELPQPHAEIEQEMNRLKQYYWTNQTSLLQIDNFRTTYDRFRGGRGPVHWFTNCSFMSKVLQRALQAKDMNQLFGLRFFIHDLYFCLQDIQEKGTNQSDLIVYRSMLPPQDYDHPINEPMTTNTFLSTSISSDVARIFFEPNLSMLYEIHTGLRAETDFVYANLSQLDSDANNLSNPPLPDEQEVLFALYTPFRIHAVKIEEEPRRVVLHLLNRQEYQIISDHVKQHCKDTQCEEEKLLKRGRYWEGRNDIDKAVNYYKKLFTILLVNEKKSIYSIDRELKDLYDEEQE